MENGRRREKKRTYDGDVATFERLPIRARHLHNDGANVALVAVQWTRKAQFFAHQSELLLLLRR